MGQLKSNMRRVAPPLQCFERGDVKQTGTVNGIYVAQIRALYQHIPIVLLVNIVNSALVAIILASYKGQTWWLVFLALTIALTGAHAFGWVRYRRTSELPESARRWAVAATVGSGLSGLLWGIGSALLLPDNLVEQTFVAFVIGGMCAASLVAFSTFFPHSLPMSSPLRYHWRAAFSSTVGLYTAT